MNIKKTINYSTMFQALDMLVIAGLSQMELYYKIGQIVSRRQEKGAVVAAAEYMQVAYPNMVGFSPQNLQKFKECAHLGVALDFVEEVCYTEENHTDMECKNNGEDTFCVPWKYLQESNGRVCDEGLGEKSGAGESVPHRVRSHQH